MDQEGVGADKARIVASKQWIERKNNILTVIIGTATGLLSDFYI